MIITNRRHRLLYICMAGMVVASSLPLLYLMLALVPNLQASALAIFPVHEQLGVRDVLDQNPLHVFVVLWSVMLAYMLTADLINRPNVESPLREVLIVSMPILTSMLAIRLLIYPTVPLLSGRWIAMVVHSLLNFTQGLRIELAVVLLNVYLWLRTALLTDNDLTFLHVGMSFRVAMLLSLFGNALLTVYVASATGLAALLYLLYLSFGLFSVALARIDQMAIGVANSRGSLLPWSRMAQIVATTLLLIALMVATGNIFTPAVLRSILRVFSPLWVVVRWILVQAIYFIFLLLTPVLERLAQLLSGLMVDMEPQPVPEQTLAPAEYVGISDMVREVALVRYCLVAVIIAVVAGLLLLFFVRTARRVRHEEDEETIGEDVTFGAGMARRGLDRLRAWLQMLRHFGMTKQLLDAITVENMYANLLRLAHLRGFPRHPATSPDKFLPILQQVFPNREQPLTEITSAYMRVYYGERAVDSDELDQLRHVYQTIIESIDEDAGTEHLDDNDES